MKWVRLAAAGTALTLLGAAGAVAAQGGADLGAVRAEFRQAWTRARNNQADAPDSPALRAYPIYPYLQSARLQRALRQQDTQADAAIAAFLQAHPNEPVSAGLLRSWLANLAQREEWDQFLDHYSPEVADLNLRCSEASARVATDDTKELLEGALELWSTPSVLPSSCSPMIDWLREQHQLTPARVEQRARAALAGGDAALADTLLHDLPPAAAAPLHEWVLLLQRPHEEIDHVIHDPAVPVEWQALLDGFTKLARRDPDTAAGDFAALTGARSFTTPQTGQLTRAVALGFAWSRQADAVEWFDRAPIAADDEVAQDWRLRADLLAGDWKRARLALAALPAARQTEVRWRYWGARLLQAEGNGAAARTAYQGLLSETGFYAAAAAWRLGLGYAPQSRAVLADATVLDELNARAPAIRARELVQVGLESQAGPEWQVLFTGASERERAQAPLLAFQWGWYEQAIASATRQGIRDDYALLYPRPYDAVLQRASERSGVPMDWLYAVLRQESLYRADAVSSRGAIGLLQLLPETAQRVALRLGMPAPSRDALFDPATNTLLGASKLRDVLSQFDDSLLLALAAYNAGENAAARWRPPVPVDADIWIENIPYNETRGYIQRILWHLVIFSWQSQRQGLRLDSLLQPVNPVVPAGPTP